MPLQWKNVYVLPEHSRLNISNKEIQFSVGPTFTSLDILQICRSLRVPSTAN